VAVTIRNDNDNNDNGRIPTVFWTMIPYWAALHSATSELRQLSKKLALGQRARAIRTIAGQCLAPNAHRQTVNTRSGTHHPREFQRCDIMVITSDSTPRAVCTVDAKERFFVKLSKTLPTRWCLRRQTTDQTDWVRGIAQSSQQPPDAERGVLQTRDWCY
jgi:hypothetical protein